MKRSRIQGHGEEGWGIRGSRFDRGAVEPDADAGPRGGVEVVVKADAERRDGQRSERGDERRALEVRGVVRARGVDLQHVDVINGLLLTFNDKFRPGEEIMFGDVAGIVTQMGWFDTKIRLYSERTVVVPNGQIMGVPLVNFSRMRWGQYKTELRLRLEDVSRVETAIANLKEALAPHVITNGRNLWVHWRRIDKDALVVVVDVKLPYPGGSTAYYDAARSRVEILAEAPSTRNPRRSAGATSSSPRPSRTPARSCAYRRRDASTSRNNQLH